MMNIKSLMLRSVSGIVYVAVIVGCILLGQNGVTALGVFFSALATIEFFKITRLKHDSDLNSRDGCIKSPRCVYLKLVLDLCIVLCIVLITPIGLVSFIGVPLLLIRLITEIYSKSECPLRSVGLSMMSYIYIGLPISMMLFLTIILNTTIPLLIIFIMIWLNDTGAFLVGSAIGRHPLFSRVSPKKSWEGFIGGLAFNVIASVLCYFYVSPQDFPYMNIYLWIGLGIIVTVFATYGDLFESLYKRSLGIKDSGNIIPGHGGILDRVDSLLLVLPASFFYILLIHVI